MATLADFALAIVGLLTITAYGVRLAMGATPEHALLLAIGGGLLIGLLMSLALRMLAAPGTSHPPDGREATPHAQTETP